ncbi:MAG: hypothetical protein CAK90_06940 [Spartobacteria bacterium AMD-G4]|nr:MAG: hypothetical protein CAK90_06940 [Spartobacteria bacterium AMD-G4]
MNSEMKVHPIVYFLFKFVVRLVLLLIFIGLPAATYYQSIRGIGFGAKEALSKALSSPTLEVSMEQLSINPFMGLVAKGVQVRERGNASRVLTSINQVAVSLNLGELMLQRVIVNSLSLRMADASIPVSESPDGPRASIKDINAEIVLLGDSLRVSTFEAAVEGIRVRFTGEVQNPFAFQLPEPDKKQGSTAKKPLFEKILSHLSEISFSKGEPLIQGSFKIDAAHPESLEIPDLSVTCAQIAWRGISLSDLQIQGEYTDARLRVPVIKTSDSTGNLQASGEWEPSSGKARLSMRANLNPGPILRSLTDSNQDKNEVHFRSAPQFEAEATADFTQAHAGLRVIGDFLAPSVAYKGVELREVGCGFAWADQRLHVRDISFQAKRGVFSGNLWIAPHDYRLQAHTTIPPTDLSPLVDGPTREFLDKMEIADLPEITLSLRAPKMDFAAIKGTGHLKLGRTAMRGAWIDSGSANLEIGDSCVNYKDIVIITGPGKGTGAFAYDVGRQEVRLENIRSTLIPYEVLMWIDPKIAKTISPYRFRSNPNVAVQGKVHMRLATKNNLSIQVESPAGMDYDLLGKTLSFGKTSAKVLVIGNKVEARVTRAPIMGGEVTLNADVSIDPKAPFLTADVKLERVNFSKLTKLYFDYDDSKGVVSGKYNFKTKMGQEEQMTGKGSIRIEDGNVFAIPTLGPFSSIIGAILPGVAYNTARLATADFSVANKKVTTKNIEIVGSGFSMFGDGDIYFLTGQLDMDMRLNAQGVPGILFFPVSKLLEYHSNGTFSDPGWLPKIIPSIPAFGGTKKSDDRTP